MKLLTSIYLLPIALSLSVFMSSGTFFAMPRPCTDQELGLLTKLQAQDWKLKNNQTVIEDNLIDNRYSYPNQREFQVIDDEEGKRVLVNYHVDIPAEKQLYYVGRKVFIYDAKLQSWSVVTEIRCNLVLVKHMPYLDITSDYDTELKLLKHAVADPFLFTDLERYMNHVVLDITSRITQSQ